MQDRDGDLGSALNKRVMPYAVLSPVSWPHRCTHRLAPLPLLGLGAERGGATCSTAHTILMTLWIQST